MDSSVIMTSKAEGIADIAIVGGGPAALVLAIALARRGIRTTVLERDAHPERMPRFNPDRSYTIDISGHGLRALRHIDACAMMLGVDIFGQAKRADISYSEVRRKAERLWPLWV